MANERDELLISNMLEIGALLALLDRKGLLCRQREGRRTLTMRVPMIAIGAILSVCLNASCLTNKGEFLLVNKGNEPVLRALVTVCGQTVELNGIQPTKSASGSYRVKSDSQYDVRIEFESGKKLEKKIGYVTNGLDFKHVIVVTDTDIEITESKAVAL